ncbi:MAG TPA: hypothetical protein VNN72_01940 [Polyangiaceae bacterium]|nr:hypothetical protein [Polyangiaceae bacterium]
MSLDGYPLHRLNTGHIKAWLLSRVLRREMASFLAKTYRTGCVVLSPTLRAFATVDPRGVITELPPPHRKFEFWQISNKPSLRAGECACRNYWDPETEGPWGARDRERERDIHHPHCQSRPVSQLAWTAAKTSADARVAEGRAPQARPDEWSRQAKELES